MVNDARKFRSIKPNFIQFTESGQQVTGTLLAREWIDVGHNTTPKYIVQTDSERVAFLGTTQIAEALEGLPMGSIIRVTYKETQDRPGGRKLKEFDVEVAIGEVNQPVNQTPAQPEKAVSK